MKKNKILVTGANGFIGQAILNHLKEIKNTHAFGSVRQIRISANSNIPLIEIGDLNEETDWSDALSGVDIVIHSAARVHVMNDQSADPIAEFRKTNVAGTLNLAHQAIAAGVRRFLFISSIKVNGENTELGKPFTADDVPTPSDPYGISKLEAEQGLLRLAAETGLEVVIIRPVLVYGPGVKANFLSMMRWLSKGIPLPLGAIYNKRSLVALDNLIDLIVTCLDHPAAKNQVFLVSDGEDLSTTELLRRMGVALGKPARLLPLPASWLDLVAALLGKRNVTRRLCETLQVDTSKTRKLLGWQPPLSVDQGLKKAAEGLTK